MLNGVSRIEILCHSCSVREHFRNMRHLVGSGEEEGAAAGSCFFFLHNLPGNNNIASVKQRMMTPGSRYK